MERFRNYAKQTEIRNLNEQEFICEIIVNKIERKFNVRFPKVLSNGIRLSNLNIITTILLIEDFSKYKEETIRLLNEANVNEKAILYHLIGVINQNDIGCSTSELALKRKELILEFQKLPYHSDLYFDDEVLSICTKYGQIEVFKYSRIIKDPNILSLIRKVPFNNRCHFVTKLIKDYYPDDYIVTSELPYYLEVICITHIYRMKIPFMI